MSVRSPVFFLLILLAVAGCQSPPPAKNSAKPNFGPPITDVRTEAKIIEMENQYIADKNDQPTHQHEAEAKAAKKKQAKALQEQKAREQKAAQEKQAAEAAAAK